MLTGEKAPEEIEFEKDKAILDKDIQRLTVIENTAEDDKIENETLLSHLKRDAT